MIIQLSDLHLCLNKATEANGHYRTYVGHDHFPRSVSDLYSMCEEVLGLKIIRRRLRIPAASSSFKAAFIKKNSHYEIYLLQGVVGSEQRLIEAKELFHVLLDDPKYHSTDLYAHLEEISVTLPQADSTPNPAAISEQMAEFAAMEFLFPHKERLKVQTPNPDYAGTADLYGIPQYYVEKYLHSAWLKVMKWS